MGIAPSIEIAQIPPVTGQRLGQRLSHRWDPLPSDSVAAAPRHPPTEILVAIGIFAPGAESSLLPQELQQFRVLIVGGRRASLRSGLREATARKSLESPSQSEILGRRVCLQSPTLSQNPRYFFLLLNSPIIAFEN